MLSFEQAKELAARTGVVIQFDQYAQSPYFYYEDSMGVSHVVWFDNEASIRARLQLVRIFNLGGISLWTINLFSPESYLTLIEEYDIRKVLTS
jgi:spore germination protein